MKKLVRSALLFVSVLAFDLAPASAQYVMRVPVAPPPMQVEVTPAPRSVREVWIPGHWTWRPAQRRHVWMPGHFAVRPAINRVWQPAQWVQEGTYWVFRPGRWVMAPVVGGPVPPPPVMRVAPPPPQPVYPPPRPAYPETQPRGPVYVQPMGQPAYPPGPQYDYDPALAEGQPMDAQLAPPVPQAEAIPVAPSVEHIWIPGHWQWQPNVGRHVWAQGHYVLRRTGMVWQPAQWHRRGPRWHYIPGHWRRF